MLIQLISLLQRFSFRNSPLDLKLNIHVTKSVVSLKLDEDGQFYFPTIPPLEHLYIYIVCGCLDLLLSQNKNQFTIKPFGILSTSTLLNFMNFLEPFTFYNLLEPFWSFDHSQTLFLILEHFLAFMNITELCWTFLNFLEPSWTFLNLLEFSWTSGSFLAFLDPSCPLVIACDPYSTL